jgi:squalene-hopene/tetraprenyl-beta-curcumene cyclase
MCLGVGLCSTGSSSDVSVTTSWSPRAAASYLDSRESWWMGWPAAARDHGTFCMSCHTAMPYALARPVLGAALGEHATPEPERRLLENVRKRVRFWKDEKPYYSEQANKSRGTEAVLNALILASSDAPNGKLSEDTRAALNNMWVLQKVTGEQKGSWPWIDFRNEPWEADDSPYFGACLAAITVGTAPENYGATPEIRDNLNLLREYLTRESPKQSFIDQVILLWASTKLPGLIDARQQKSIIDEILSKQRPDGGWSLSSLVWTWRGTSLYSLAKLWARSEGTPLEAKSDGYATGLISLVLEQAGLARQDVRLQRGLAWLVHNQSQADGGWPAYSLNNRRDPSSGTGHFMRDAATAFAVLALSKAN